MNKKPTYLTLALALAIGGANATTLTTPPFNPNSPPVVIGNTNGNTTPIPTTTPPATGTTGTAGTGTTSPIPTTTPAPTPTPTPTPAPTGSTGTTTSTNPQMESRNCEVYQGQGGIDDIKAQRVGEVANNGMVVSTIIDDFKKSPVAQNCLAGFANSLDLSGMIPVVNSGTFSGSAMKNMIMQGIKKTIEMQKEKIKAQVCGMADEALTGALNHIKGQIKETTDSARAMASGDAVAGAIAEQIEKSNQGINNALDKHLGNLEKRLQMAQDSVEKVKILDNQIATIGTQIDNYANQATTAINQAQSAQSADLSGAVNSKNGTPQATSPIPTTPKPTTPAPTTANNSGSNSNNDGSGNLEKGSRIRDY